MSGPLYLPALRMGAAALRLNPVRSVLATLGVVMGAGALVSVLSLGDGMERFARSSISQRGVDLVGVMPLTDDTLDGVRVPRATVAPLGAEEARLIARAFSPGERAALMTNAPAILRVANATRARAANLTAYLDVQRDSLGVELLAGRAMTAAETGGPATVAVISRGLAELLRPNHPAGAVGDSVKLSTGWARVVGVSKPATDGDRSLWLHAPLSAEGAMIEGRAPRARTLLITAARVEDVQALRARVTQALAARDPQWRARYAVQAQGEDRLREVQRGIRIFKMLMGAFAGISLIVGGIGIMNVLLASVAERTREIGIRKAVGARARDIMAQFLAESITITGVGSALGCALGLAVSFGVTALMRARTAAVIHAGISVGTILVAAGASVIVGLVFGVYPALRAARLEPIVAIHTE